MAERYAAILAGGSGTRFWPLSRRSLPKQFLPLAGAHSLLRQTAERLFPLFHPDRVFVVTAADQAAKVREELEILPPENIIDEPVPRDTAAAAALFAQFIEWRDPGASLGLLPADHFISPAPVFQAALIRAFDAAIGRRAAVTFGIPADRPATQYGYLQSGPAVEEGVFSVKRFREKPDRASAEALLKEGGWFWNSGIFVWRAADLLAAVRAHLPAHQAMLDALAPRLGTSELPQAMAREYDRLPRVSIDYGIMEKLSGALMIRAPFAWSDVGTWPALAGVRPADGAGNIVEGNVTALDSRGSVLMSGDDHLVAVFGVDRLVVIHTPDATLVCPADRADELKRLIALLEQQGKGKHL